MKINMNFKFWFKNILKFLVSLMALSYEIYMVYVYLYESPELDSLYSLIVALGMTFGAIIVTLWYARCKIIPKYIKEMRAVRKFMTFSDLKEALESEKFVPIKLSYGIKNLIEKSDVKGFEKELLVSKKWISVDKVLIPKKMIASIDARSAERGYEIEFTLVTKASYSCGPRSYENDEVADYLRKCNQLSQMGNSYTDEDEYIEKFKRQVQTREDFLRYIQ